jgi:gliding motility-associated-like protein
MVTIRLMFVLLLVSNASAQAQPFVAHKTILLPAGSTGVNFRWLDVNLDGSLDLLVLTKDTAGKHSFLFYQNNEGDFGLAGTLETGLSMIDYTLLDIDQDGANDIVYTGWHDQDSVTSAYLHKIDFTFEPSAQPFTQQAGSNVWMADLDQDGQPELMLSGVKENVPFFRQYKRVENNWTLLPGSLAIHVIQLNVFDFNRDGINDLLISGTRADASVYTALLILDGERNSIQERPITSVVPKSITLADWNHDGIFDIIMAGIKPDGIAVVSRLESLPSGEFTEVLLETPDFMPRYLFAADFNSDGRVDYYVDGIDEDLTSSGKIVYQEGDAEQLANATITCAEFGDWDYDGDLDLARLEGEAAHELILYQNATASINDFPGPPTDAIGILLFNRVFLFWQQPEDDHTPQASLTYDIILQSTTTNAVTGNFDLVTRMRTQVTHGNNGTNPFAQFRNMNESNYSFYIQAIDNAFHAGPSICSGECTSCLTLEEKFVSLCGNETATLVSDGPAYWFSFQSGFLGQRTSYTVSAQSDTLIAYHNPVNNACARVEVFIVEHKNNDTRKSTSTRYLCEGTQVVLTADPGWKNTTWTSSFNGFISNTPSITRTITQSETVTVVMTDGAGCTIERSTLFTISKPDITLNGEVFTIMRGSSAQLVASGGERYEWQPPQGLSNSTIPNPIASPSLTTAYTVTVTDSIGCTASRNMLVQVESEAFIPNLFTPNQDGKNDFLKIFGLIDPGEFSFIIYNREGNQVYVTNTASDITQSGWDGTVRGKDQPAGVYIWKVQGVYTNGQPVLLNGKDSGSVVLIR